MGDFDRYSVTVPYHVRVYLRSEPHWVEVSLDLTRAQLDDRFLRPHSRGETMVISGRTVDPGDLKRIQISFSEAPSAELRPAAESARLARRIAYPFEWYIADQGVDVTDDLIAAQRTSSSLPTAESSLAADPDPRIVFVIHGRDLKAAEAMFTFLRALDLRPIEWDEAVIATGESTPYVGEILAAGFRLARTVVVLMTPDDEARLRQPFHRASDPAYETELTGQARPNVLFEAGMAMGMRADRTVLVEFGECRPFSDISGRHLLRLDNSTERRQALAQRLRNGGAAVDMSGTAWHRAGDFN